MKKNIVIGVCGSIAVYKVPETIRCLMDRGWNVRVVMTAEAQKFMTPLIFETLSGNRVSTDMFVREEWEIAHISLADFASLVLVVPATALIIGKAANGMCDDLLSCMLVAAACPVVYAPAMNDRMWRHPAVRKNVETLKKYGCVFIGPEKGRLACGAEGVGRLAETAAIIDGVEREAKNGKKL